MAGFRRPLGLLNGEKKADFAIELDRKIKLVATDFVL